MADHFDTTLVNTLTAGFGNIRQSIAIAKLDEPGTVVFTSSAFDELVEQPMAELNQSGGAYSILPEDMRHQFRTALGNRVPTVTGAEIKLPTGTQLNALIYLTAIQVPLHGTYACMILRQFHGTIPSLKKNLAQYPDLQRMASQNYQTALRAMSMGSEAVIARVRLEFSMRSLASAPPAQALGPLPLAAQ